MLAPTCNDTVYPRVCGGTKGMVAGANVHVGLSPRVRGNRVAVPVFAGRIGSIPACAGEPSCENSALASAKVYPRVCGGTLI